MKLPDFIKLKGSSFIYKYLFNNSIKFLKLSFIKVVDTWTEPGSNKQIYVIKLRFKDPSTQRLN